MADTAPRFPNEVLMISLLRQYLPKAFPVLMNRGNDQYRWGVSRPLKLGTPGRGGHCGGMEDGRLIKAKAADVYLDAARPYEKKLGDALFRWLLLYRASLGIDFIVWNNEKSTSAGTIRNYHATENTRSARHEDHLHIEFKPQTGDRDHSDVLKVVIGEVKLALGEPLPPYE
ncbi:MAG: hypothetical protein DIJKHBIC_04784 [Thermoanaerobaculia bacterium]|nr:hypothetical protein [Thermoanaerobaculia bacterium]